MVRCIQPSFGGINLEDISQPKCFRVLDMLRTDPEVQIPVWHDDQQGTATVVLTGVLNALKIVGKKTEIIGRSREMPRFSLMEKGLIPPAPNEWLVARHQ